MVDLDATVRKRNISGEDLEVVLLDNQIVKAGEEVDMPVYYAWHTDDDPAPVGYSDQIWADVAPSKKAAKAATSETE